MPQIIFPIANSSCATNEIPTVSKRHHLELRPDLLLARNIRALLTARGEDDSALATWCGHRPAWLSKILNGERGMQIRDLGRVADFFGVEVSQLFQRGVDPLLERRVHGRRIPGGDRRTGIDRRQSEHIEAAFISSKEAPHAPASRALPPADPNLLIAERLTALAERIESLAATFLARHAATLGDASPDSPEGNPGLRRAERRSYTRKTG